MARDGTFDLIVGECAPTDAMLRLVTLPDVSHGTGRLVHRFQRPIALLVLSLASDSAPYSLPDSRAFRDSEPLLDGTFRRLCA